VLSPAGIVVIVVSWVGVTSGAQNSGSVLCELPGLLGSTVIGALWISLSGSSSSVLDCSSAGSSDCAGPLFSSSNSSTSMHQGPRNGLCVFASARHSCQCPSYLTTKKDFLFLSGFRNTSTLYPLLFFGSSALTNSMCGLCSQLGKYVIWAMSSQMVWLGCPLLDAVMKRSRV
jgi:hypothetical protein